MRLHFSSTCPMWATLLVVICLWFTPILVAAQDETPAPQFLYRDENRLIIVDGYTGEISELTIELEDRDRVSWSPDGRYLMVESRDDIWGCLDIYDVDQQEWLSEEPISCGVEDALFSSDDTQLIYSVRDGVDGALWVYNLDDETRQELFRTTDGSNNNPSGISRLVWSPTESYLTFVSYHQVMGGTLNVLVIMNFQNQNHHTLTVRNPYYASYYPIWSKDDRWFLIVLKDEYVTSGALPQTNHEGDVYLINSETADAYRLSYTPASDEVDVRWTEDGSIAFTTITVSVQDIVLTPEEAMSVAVVPYENIVTPEPLQVEQFVVSYWDVMVSPNSDLGVWVTTAQASEVAARGQLNFGNYFSPSREVHFSKSISNINPENLIGWRPSDYPYPIG